MMPNMNFYEGDVEFVQDTMGECFEINQIIQDNDHLHYRFFNSAYIFNGQETEILFFEHPSAQPFKIQDNNIIRVKVKDRYQEFIVNEWRWAGFDLTS